MNIKLWLKLAFTLIMLTAFTGLATAQQKNVAPPPGATVQPAPGGTELAPQDKGLMDKGRARLFTGKVTQADNKTKTVTILGTNGETVRLNYSNAREGTCGGAGARALLAPASFPKVGDNVRAMVSDDCAQCLATC